MLAKAGETVGRKSDTLRLERNKVLTPQLANHLVHRHGRVGLIDAALIGRPNVTLDANHNGLDARDGSLSLLLGRPRFQIEILANGSVRRTGKPFLQRPGTLTGLTSVKSLNLMRLTGVSYTAICSKRPLD